jgi:hypothetical protein
MSAKPEDQGMPQETLARYERLIATIPNLERKGAKMPYTSLNGHMFSFLSPEGVLGIRLPREAREAFLEKYNTRLCEQYGRVMKEYVEVPDALLSNTDELKESFATSCEYVQTLKPKPTKKK